MRNVASATPGAGPTCVIVTTFSKSAAIPVYCRHAKAVQIAGRTVTYELKPGRGAWLHIAEGALALNSVTLTTGDGASTEEPGTLTLTANRSKLKRFFSTLINQSNQT